MKTLSIKIDDTVHLAMRLALLKRGKTVQSGLVPLIERWVEADCPEVVGGEEE